MSGCQPKICDEENVNVNKKIMQAISGYPLADKDITRDFSPIIAWQQRCYNVAWDMTVDPPIFYNLVFSDLSFLIDCMTTIVPAYVPQCCMGYHSFDPPILLLHSYVFLTGNTKGTLRNVTCVHCTLVSTCHSLFTYCQVLWDLDLFV